MFRVKNLSKTYITKKGAKTLALNNINIAFPEKGMIFIIGKSGCGKSTLLNILGGIEKPTDGQIFYNNSELGKFSFSEMDYYRANHIGFIFQDYNLIGHLSVKENLMIASDIKGRLITEQDINYVLNKVGLIDFINHLPEEMSGGQQQRVAIARALLKNPEVILADEPTGNLDSTTGEDIFKLFKELSQTKLVIIVSHDKGNAELYGDAIIELKDGKIISDSSIGDFEQTNKKIDKENNGLYNKKSKFKFKNRIKYSLHNLKKKPITLALAMILCILAIGCGVYAQALTNFKMYKNLPLTLKTNNIKYFNFDKSKYDYEKVIGATEFNNILNAYGNNYYYKITDGNDTVIINGKDDIERIGLKLKSGSKEIDNNSIYITDIKIKGLMEYNSYYSFSEGSFKTIQNIEDFIGTIYWGKSLDSLYLNVAGIIETGYAGEEFFAGTAQNKEQTMNQYFYKYLSKIFCTESYLRNNTPLNSYSSIIKINESKIEYEKKIIVDEYSYHDLFDGLNGSMLLFKDGMIDEGSTDIKLNYNECILPLQLYNELFNTSYHSNDFCDLMDFQNEPKVMPELEQTITITINGENQNKVLQDIIVVGIVFYPSLLSYEDNDISDIYISQDHINSIIQNFDIRINQVMGIINDYSQFSNLLKNTDFIIKSPYSEELYQYEENIGYFRYNLFLISGIILIISIFLLYYYISNCIASEKKNIGILRSLGAKQRDIESIYLLQGTLISFIISSITTSIIIPLVGYANILQSKNIIIGAILITLNPLMIVESLFTSFIAMLFAVLIPTIKLSRMKPIDVIRKI